MLEVCMGISKQMFGKLVLVNLHIINHDELIKIRDEINRKILEKMEQKDVGVNWNNQVSWREKK